MKKTILLLTILCLNVSASFAAWTTQINHFLWEISYQQAKTHPRQHEITTYTYSLNGMRTTRYFTWAKGLPANAKMTVLEAKSARSPWKVKINEDIYYVEFHSDVDNIKVGTSGTLKYHYEWKVFFFTYI